MAKRRPEADDLLRMAEHRRKMQALGRVAETAGRVASSGELRHLRPVADPADTTGIARTAGDEGVEDVESLAPVADAAEGVVVSLAAERARRAGHPAGSGRVR